MSAMRALVRRPGARSGETRTSDERTSQRRVELRRGLRLECEAVAEDGFRLIGQRTLDVSSTGMLVETHGSYARLGEEVIVSFRPPESRLWVDAVARVARIVVGRRKTDRAQAIGLSFVAMDAADRAILRAKLHGHPPPIPARQPPLDYAAAVRAISAG